MPAPSLKACPGFWKDVKSLQKHMSSKAEVASVYDIEEFKEVGDADKAYSIPLIKAITNYIFSYIPPYMGIDKIATLYGKQPFLTEGWNVQKMRWPVDKRGKRGGLRIIFCENGQDIILIKITMKKDCDEEPELEAEFMERIKEYLTL